MNRAERFEQVEKILFRIHFGILFFGIGLLSYILIFVDSIKHVAEGFLYLVLTLFYSAIASFIVSIIRLIRYFTVIKKTGEGKGVKRSASMLFTSPITFLVYLILILAMSLSMASCTIT